MRKAMIDFFSPYFRVRTDGTPQTADGLTLSLNSAAIELAKKLFEEATDQGAEEKAIEIVKLLKPFCLRFDTVAMQGELVKAMRARQGSRKRQTLRETDQRHRTAVQ